MSTALVDLLPPEIAGRRRNRRLTAWTALAVAAFVGVLAGVYVAQIGAVGQARSERDTVAAQVASRESRVAALQPYAEMGARLEARNTVLAHAMADEVSWSRLLNDVALALPADASLQTLTATTGHAGGDDPAAAPAAGEAGETALGRLDVTGYTTGELSPGVRSVLDHLPEIQGLVEPYLSTSEATDLHGREITSFTLGADLDDGAESARYDQGLPPEATR